MANEKSTPRNTITIYGDGSTPYIVKGNDDYIKVNTSGGAISIFVPNILGSGLNNSVKRFYIADASGTAATNKITLYPTGGDSMNGTTYLDLDVNNVTAELLIVNNTEWQVNLSGDSGTPATAAFGAITGTPSNQANLQDGTIQGGTFTPSNIAVALGDSFRTAFQKLQGQITAFIASFIPFVSTNYVAVKATGIGTANGAALIAAVTAAQALTPNGAALSATNRAVVYLFAGIYDLGSSFFSLGQFVDIIVIGDSKDVVITSSNATGTIQIADNNDYAIKNCTINNTGSGGSITHNAGQTDNGIWDNLILGAKNTEGTTFSGNYYKLECNSDNILNGNILGEVINSKFLNFSCGSLSNISADLTMSGTVDSCTGNNSCFGYSSVGNMAISGDIKNSSANDDSFGRLAMFNGTLTISGTMDNNTGRDGCFGINGVSSVVISGTMDNNTGRDYCFGLSNISTTTISGTMDNNTGRDYCFGSSNGIGTYSTSGTIKRCTAAKNSFGDTTSTGKLINCYRTEGFGTHAGTIDSCRFSENDATRPAITVASGAKISYSKIYQAGAGQCIDGANGTTASIYQNAMNKIENVVNVTNNITTPYNVVDANVIL